MNPTYSLTLDPRKRFIRGHTKNPATIKHLVMETVADHSQRYLWCWLPGASMILIRSASPLTVPNGPDGAPLGILRTLPDQDLSTGARVRVQSILNPTRKDHGTRRGVSGEDAQQRVLDYFGESVEWLGSRTSDQGYRSFRPGPRRPHVSLSITAFVGNGIIQDAERFAELYDQGIGSARAYGNGLLLVGAPRGRS